MQRGGWPRAPNTSHTTLHYTTIPFPTLPYPARGPHTPISLCLLYTSAKKTPALSFFLCTSARSYILSCLSVREGTKKICSLDPEIYDIYEIDRRRRESSNQSINLGAGSPSWVATAACPEKRLYCCCYCCCRCCCCHSSYLNLSRLCLHLCPHARSLYPPPPPSFEPRRPLRRLRPSALTRRDRRHRRRVCSPGAILLLLLLPG